MVDFIHNNKDRYGVDAICRILPIAASTYYRTLDLADNPEHRAKRDLHDEHHAEQIKRIWKESSGRYGVRKVWQQLKREGYVIARCTVARLMQKLGIQGVWRGKNKQTTRSRDDQKRADDLVKRNFNADHPDPCEAVLLTFFKGGLHPFLNGGWEGFYKKTAPLRRFLLLSITPADVFSIRHEFHAVIQYLLELLPVLALLPAYGAFCSSVSPTRTPPMPITGS